MKITKIVISTFLFLGLGVNGFCLNVEQHPTVDFGTINYLYNGAGFGQVTISDAGTPSTGGVGYIMNQSGGSAGTLEFSISGWEILFGRTISLEIPENSYTTEGRCAQVTISSIKSDSTRKSANILTSRASFNIGATLTLDSFTGHEPCSIEYTFPSVMTGSNSSDSKPVNLTIRVQIIPNMAVTHDSAALNFGTICRSTTQQQVLTIAPDGGVSGTYVCPTQNTSADSFTVTGNIGQSFNVNLQNSTTITNGSTNLTVSNLTPSCSSNCQLTANTYNLTVGGTLTVPSGTPTGEYTGNYNLSITY